MIQEENTQDFLKNKILNKYYIELDNDVKINLSNLQQKNLLCSSIRAKWLMYLTKAKEDKKRLRQAKEDLKNSLLNSSNTLSNKSILQQKNEDNALKDNEQLKKINIALEQLDETIIFLEYAWNILNDFGYNIKNIIELIKLEQV